MIEGYYILRWKDYCLRIKLMLLTNLIAVLICLKELVFFLSPLLEFSHGFGGNIRVVGMMQKRNGIG